MNFPYFHFFIDDVPIFSRIFFGDFPIQKWWCPGHCPSKIWFQGEMTSDDSSMWTQLQLIFQGRFFENLREVAAERWKFSQGTVGFPAKI